MSYALCTNSGWWEKGTELWILYEEYTVLFRWGEGREPTYLIYSGHIEYGLRRLAASQNGQMRTSCMAVYHQAPVEEF